MVASAIAGFTATRFSALVVARASRTLILVPGRVEKKGSDLYAEQRGEYLSLVP